MISSFSLDRITTLLPNFLHMHPDIKVLTIDNWLLGFHIFVRWPGRLFSKSQKKFGRNHPLHGYHGYRCWNVILSGWTEDEWVKLHQLHKQRCFKLDNDHTQNNLWNFWSAFDFCATVLTTIGLLKFIMKLMYLLLQLLIQTHLYSLSTIVPLQSLESKLQTRTSPSM